MKIDLKSQLEWDDKKLATNIKDKGISFGLAKLMVNAFYSLDTRKDYGEPRIIVAGLIMGRLHIMVVTPRGDKLRIISLRKANKREVKSYEKKAL